MNRDGAGQRVDRAGTEPGHNAGTGARSGGRSRSGVRNTNMSTDSYRWEWRTEIRVE